MAPPWRHPDARGLGSPDLAAHRLRPRRRRSWEAAERPPRWLLRAAAPRLWFGGKDGLPTGYLELLQALALAEGVLAIDEDARPRRIVAGPHARAWRRIAFGAQTARLRERWLRLPRWIEGEPAGVVDVWGADWRGMRPRLLTALADPEIGMIPPRWVTLESVALRLGGTLPEAARALVHSGNGAPGRRGGSGRRRRRGPRRGAERRDRARARRTVCLVRPRGNHRPPWPSARDPSDRDRRRAGQAAAGASGGRCRGLVGAACRRSLRRDHTAIAVARPGVGAHCLFRARRSRPAKPLPAHPGIARAQHFLPASSSTRS